VFGKDDIEKLKNKMDEEAGTQPKEKSKGERAKEAFEAAQAAAESKSEL